MLERLDLSALEEADRFAQRSDALMTLANNVRAMIGQAEREITAARAKVDEDAKRLLQQSRELAAKAQALADREAAVAQREDAVTEREAARYDEG